ncbi:MAG: 3'(2'),5'-bisphosphate nucleotidase CysQ [Candidatus Saccharimonadales bacterium]
MTSAKSNNKKQIVLAEILPKLVRLAQQAGLAAVNIYQSQDLDVSYKADHSPLSRADVMCNQIIVDELMRLAPEVVIVSEESPSLETKLRLAARTLWLVDPIDGTKGFVAGSPDYTINIGLVEDGWPALGVVYAPSHSLMYYGAIGLGAWKQQLAPDADLGLAAPPQRLQVQVATQPPVVAVSRGQQNPQVDAYLAKLEPHSLLPVGSSLKICYVADGTVSIYPRLNPCMEWDTAAADAVLRAAGGTVLQLDEHQQPGAPLIYNKSDLYNPPFIAQFLS